MTLSGHNHAYITPTAQRKFPANTIAAKTPATVGGTPNSITWLIPLINNCNRIRQPPSNHPLASSGRNNEKCL